MKRTKLLNKYTDNVFKVCVFEVCGLFRLRFLECLFFCIFYNNYKINSIREITSIKKEKRNIVVCVFETPIGHYRNVRGLGKSMVVFRWKK